MNKGINSEVFVGRDRVLQRLQVHYRRLMEESQGGLVFIAGEAGIGKTTVVNRFLNSLATHSVNKRERPGPSPCILPATCDQIADPYAPFAKLFDELHGKEQIPQKETLLEWARELGPKLLEGIVPYLGPLLGKILEKQLGKADQAKQIGTTFATSQAYYLIQLLEKLSKTAPLLLFIDDVHWADESSINLIFALARRTAGLPILLIGTYRPHDIIPRPDGSVHPLAKTLGELGRYELCDEIFLERFTPDETRAYLDGCLPSNRLSSALAAILHHETDGIPFFLNQVLQLLVDEGHIYRAPDGVWEAKEIDKIPIPKHAMDIVQMRINGLNAEFVNLLRYASVMGQQFHSHILAKVASKTHLETSRILRDVERLHNLIEHREDASQTGLRPNWAFSHAFVHQALYDSLEPEERIEIHGLVVDAFKSQFPDAQDDLAGELAHHCEFARRYQEAIGHRLSAAIRTHRAWDWSTQIHHCEMGIADIKKSGKGHTNIETQVALYIGLLGVYRRLFELDKLSSVGHELLRLAQEYKDAQAETEGYYALLNCAELQGNTSAFCHYLNQRWSAAKRTGSTQLMFLVIRGCQYEDTMRMVYRHMPEQLALMLDEALCIGQQKDAHPLIAMTLYAKGVVSYLAGQDQQALALFADAIKAADSFTESDLQPLTSYPFLGYYFSYLRDEIVSECTEYTGRIYRQQGKWSEAIEAFRLVYGFKERDKNPPGMAGLLNVIAETQLLAGQLEEAERTFQPSWIIAQQVESRELQSMILSTGISIALELGNNVDAMTRLKLFEDNTHDSSISWLWHKKQMVRGILHTQANAFQDAETDLETGLEAAKRDGDQGLITQYSLHLAELSLLRSHPDEARQYAELATQTAKEHNLWELGEAYLALARISMQAAQVSEAKSSLEKALEYFQGKNLQHKVPLVERLLSKVIESEKNR